MEALYAAAFVFFTEWLPAFFLSLLDRSLPVLLLVLGAVLFRLVFRGAPKWLRFLVWIPVGLRLLFPFSVESAVSLQPAPSFVPSEAALLTYEELHAAYPAATDVLSQAAAPFTGAAYAAYAPPAQPVNPAQLLSLIGSLVWLAGVLGLLLWAVGSYLRLRLRLRQAVRESGNIYKSERVESPFILGVFRPRIYLPFGLDETTESFVLRHEQAHLKRRDHLIKPFAFVLASFYWFHPAVWLAFALLCRDIELACDERVLGRAAAAEKKAYAAALLHLSAPHRLRAACPLAFGEGGVKGRVKNALRFKKPALWVLLAAFLAGAALAAALLTSPKTAQPLFPQGYAAQEVLYASPVNSYLYPDGDLPLLFANAEGELSIRQPFAEGWRSYGALRPTEVSAEAFAALFGEAPAEYDAAADAARLKEAWAAGDAERPVYLFRLTGGRLLAAVTFPQPEGLRAQYLFLLKAGLPAPENAAVEAAVAAALLQDAKEGKLEGECSAEGHILLGVAPTNEAPSAYYAYVLAREANYAMLNGLFVNVSGMSIPLRMTVEAAGEAVRVIKTEYPRDGELYAPSIAALFPPEYRARAQSGYTDRDAAALKAQCEVYASAYLRKIGRNAEIVAGLWGRAEIRWLSEVLQNDVVLSEIERTPLPEPHSFPNFLGTAEYPEDGVRYVYTTGFDAAKNTVLFVKTTYEGSEEVAVYAFDAATGKRIDPRTGIPVPETTAAPELTTAPAAE